MRILLLVFPIALLVAYSQIIVKWRTVDQSEVSQSQELRAFAYLLKFLMDPVILSGYAAALFASFAWLFVITKLPLTIAFPVYIGITFGMVIIGGWYFLSEPVSITRIIAILLIFSGIILGVQE